MLNISIQKEYIHWIKQVINNPFSSLPPFCDWLDEYNISSQRWREINKDLTKVLFVKNFALKHPHTVYTPKEVQFSLPNGEIRNNIKYFREVKRIVHIFQVTLVTKQKSIMIKLEFKDKLTIVNCKKPVSFEDNMLIYSGYVPVSKFKPYYKEIEHYND